MDLKSFPPKILSLNVNRSILLTDDGDLRSQFAGQHEELAYLSPENLSKYRSRHTLNARHRLDGEWLFTEYESLLQSGRIGLPGYKRQMAYESYADNSVQPLMKA